MKYAILLMCMMLQERTSRGLVEAERGSCESTSLGAFYKVRCTNITHIPTADMIPVNWSLVSQLILANNTIKKLPDGGFRNFTNLRLLDLSGTSIQYFGNTAFTGLKMLRFLKIEALSSYNVYFEKKAFYPLISIEELNLSETVTDVTSLFAALCSFKNGIRSLLLDHIGHRDKEIALTSKDTQCMKKLGLKKLSFDNNGLQIPTLASLRNIQSLEYISVNYNLLSGADGMGIVYILKGHHLKYLAGCCQSGYRFVKDPPWKGWIKNETYIKDYPLIPTNMTVPQKNNLTLMYFLPNLNTFDIHNNAEKIHIGSNLCWKNNTLVNVDLSGNQNLTLDGTVRCMYHLRFANFRRIKNLSFKTDSFHELVSLEVLLLGSSRIVPDNSIFENENAWKIFKMSVNLRFLDLSDLGIKRVHEKLFTSLVNLEVLILSHNSLVTVKDSFINLKSLTYLDLSYNRLLTIPVNFIYQLQHNNIRKNMHIRMRGNPFICNCGTLHRLKFLLQNQNVILDNTSCILLNKNKALLPDAIKKLEQECRYVDKTSIVFLGFVYPAVLIVIITGTLGYRYRWNIAYAWYLYTQKRYKEDDNQREYMFDAFIAYSSYDEKWVRTVLLKKLEHKQEPYSLCLHDRNFVPGEYIADNIISAIENSRKTILVITKKFIKSGWCQYEMRAAEAHHRTNHKRGIVAIVFPGVHEYAKKKRTLCGLLDTVTYLEWINEEEKAQLFWVRLKKALGRPVVQRNTVDNWCHMVSRGLVT